MDVELTQEEKELLNMVFKNAYHNLKAIESMKEYYGQYFSDDVYDLSCKLHEVHGVDFDL